ncbi:MAG TPA: hypothetical protein VFE31_08600 [Opitutaceae bacterium]|jgi:hypothetical protein|nr:hypothetical protein [Opitutaceae bacterium]
MKTPPPPADRITTEIRKLYLHLLNLKREDGQPATDGVRLHREITESPELRGTLLDAGALAKYVSQDREIAADHLPALRTALDRAYNKAVDPRYSWKPRWLNARQGLQHSYPNPAR